MSDFFKPRTDVAPFNFDLLVLPEFTLMGLATTMEPLRAANRSANQELYRCGCYRTTVNLYARQAASPSPRTRASNRTRRVMH